MSLCKNLNHYDKQHHEKDLLGGFHEDDNFIMSPTNLKVKTTLYSMINSTKENYCSVAFI